MRYTEVAIATALRRSGAGGRDFAKLQNPAAIADVRGDDVGGAFLEHVAELGLRIEFLAGDHRDVDVPSGFRQPVEVAGGNRFLVFFALPG